MTDFAVDIQGSAYLNLQLIAYIPDGILTPTLQATIVGALIGDLSEPFLAFKGAFPAVLGTSTALFITGPPVVSTDIQSAIVQTAFGLVHGAKKNDVTFWKGLDVCH
jgi:hypothetical protein